MFLRCFVVYLSSIRPVDNVMDEIGADEAGAASDQEIHRINNKVTKELRKMEVQNAVDAVLY